MEIQRSGALEMFFLKLVVIVHDLFHPKRALATMMRNSSLRAEARAILKTNRKTAVPEHMLQRAEWIRLSTHRTFAATAATMALLNDRIGRERTLGGHVTISERFRKFRANKNLLIRLDRHDSDKVIAGAAGRNLEELIEYTLDLISRRFAAAEDLVFNFLPVSCHRVNILVARPGCNAFYDALIPDLQGARTSINLIMYGFRDPKGDSHSTAARIARILMDKAKSGVEVNLLLDGFGCGIYGFRKDKQCSDLIQEMIRNGVRCVFNDPWNIDDEERLFRLDHRKQFIIDGVIAYVGGMGIEDQFDNNAPDKSCHDIMVRLEGKIVHQFQCSFLSAFVYQFARNHEMRYFPLSRIRTDIREKYFPPTADDPAGVKGVCLQNIPVAGSHQITTRYLDLIEGARSYVFFANPYCSEDTFVRTIKRWIKARSKRSGGRQRRDENSFVEQGALLLLPGEIANGMVGLLKRFELPRLIHCGVKIVLYSAGFLHAKAAVQDHDKVLIGSCNLDAFSMWRNWESAVFFNDKAVAACVHENVFNHGESGEFKFLSSTYSLPWWEKSICWFLEKVDSLF